MVVPTRNLHHNHLSNMLAVVLLMMSPVTWLGSTSGQMAPHCSSTFHVWQPGHEAQQMIRDMYLKVDNMTSYTKFEISELRAQLAVEVNKIQNWTYAVDKRVFQMQIDKMDDELLQMKYSAGTDKIQMELEHVNRRVDDLERSMFNVRSKLRSSRSSGGKHGDHQHNKHYDHLPQQQGISPDMGAMLKNSVGDLKAEWILLKRDVESLKKETLNLADAQQDLRNDSTSLKLAIDSTTSETKRLEMKVYEIADQHERLEGKMDRISSDTEQVKLVLDRYKAQVIRYGADVATLQTKSSSLQRDLTDVHIKLAHINEVTPVRPHRKVQDDENKADADLLPLHLTSPEKNIQIEREDVIPETNTRSTQMPRDCHEVYMSGYKVSSIYHILPDGSRYMVPVYCEMVNNTGYTVIQRRIDGTINFNRRWSEYQHGFGNPYGEFWAGNDLLHLLTKQKEYTLRVDLWDWDGEQYYAEYSRFLVDGEKDQYRLRIGKYTGNAGDSFSYHNQMAFSTEDADNDLHERHCAAENKGGWWYNSCFYSHLNGIYHTAWYSQSQSNYADGIVWYTLKDDEFYSLRKVEMKLKPNTAAG